MNCVHTQDESSFEDPVQVVGMVQLKDVLGDWGG